MISYSPLATFLSLMAGKFSSPYFLNNKQYSNPHPLWKISEIQLWLIKITFFTYLLIQIQSVIIKTFNFTFENVSFTKLPKRISMISYVTSKVIINLKWRKCNNFFKSIIKGNIKYKKIQPVFKLLYLKNEIEGSPKIRMRAKRTNWNWNMKGNSWKDIAATIKFWRKFPLSSISNSKSLSVHEFSFLNLLQTSFFGQIYYYEIPWIILYKIWQISYLFP